jgi:2',3'-cyclic-nucleotide 2'-phosphodiesterase (5'-nucleotidase family)
MRTTINLGVMFKAVLLVPLLLWIAPPPLTAGSPCAIRIVITRDLRGWLEPCDCKAGVLGGFPRRAAVISERRPDLLLDAGDLIFQASPYDLLKLRLMLDLDGELGYAAVNLGRREVEFSRAEILCLKAESPVPLLSANLADENGKPVLPGHLLVTVGSRRLAILGAVTPDANPGPGLKVLDPVPALRREMAALPAERDLTILLSGLTAKETPQFAGVGCECCHGPSRAHAEVPLSAPRPRTPGRPRESCRICHTPDHSEKFVEAERLLALGHGKEEME